MPTYNPILKERARTLRKNMTDAEQLLWSRLRRKQILGVQFYRQRPIGNYIVDFFAPSVGLVIEVDGGQHYHGDQLEKDGLRDAQLLSKGFQMLRFSNNQVLKETEAVMEEVYKALALALDR